MLSLFFTGLGFVGNTEKEEEDEDTVEVEQKVEAFKSVCVIEPTETLSSISQQTNLSIKKKETNKAMAEASNAHGPHLRKRK